MNKTELQPARWWNQVWYQSDPVRLVVEKQAMQSHFPQFHMIQNGQTLVWKGALQSNRGNIYEIAVVYPDSFPVEPPEVYPIDPIITVWKDEQSGNLKHQYKNGKLCLYHPGDGSFSDSTTAATVVAVAAAWFFAYESWLESGKQEWPGIEAD